MSIVNQIIHKQKNTWKPSSFYLLHLFNNMKFNIKILITLFFNQYRTKLNYIFYFKFLVNFKIIIPNRK